MSIVIDGEARNINEVRHFYMRFLG